MEKLQYKNSGIEILNFQMLMNNVAPKHHLNLSSPGSQAKILGWKAEECHSTKNTRMKSRRMLLIFQVNGTNPDHHLTTVFPVPWDITAPDFTTFHKAMITLNSLWYFCWLKHFPFDQSPETKQITRQLISNQYSYWEVQYPCSFHSAALWRKFKFSKI